ncbi:MAG: hypothetical protein PVG90_11910 [Bacillota bacterium]|jgi:hypothetical protein
MKILLTLTFVLGLALLVSGNALAAVHNFNEDFQNSLASYGNFDFFNIFERRYGSFENWYYIEKDAPSATVRGFRTGNADIYGAEYFKNDQTFVNLTYHSNSDDEKSTILKGSYLFKNNFFIGLTHLNSDDSYKYIRTSISPGYRFNFPAGSGYLAVSLDYYADSDFDDAPDPDVLDYEVNGRYYTDRSRFYGQVIIFNKDPMGDCQFYKAGGAYKCSDNFVLGAAFEKVTDDYTQFEIGGTATFGKLDADFKYLKRDCDSSDNYEQYIYLNLLYSFVDNLRAGLEVINTDYSDRDDYDPYLIAKAKYTINDQNALTLMYHFKNNSADSDSNTLLYWNIKLP